MAWRIGDALVRGEIDNRVKNKITGKLWFADCDSPYLLELEGNCCQDIAGCLLTFSDPSAKPEKLEGFSPVQSGVSGEMTASRKVKVLTQSYEELKKGKIKDKPAFKWVNALYLEWYSELNGRVVIEKIDYEYSLSLPSWEFTPEDEEAQNKQSREALDAYLEAFEEMMQEVEASDGSEIGSDESVPGETADEEAIERILRINDLKHEAEELVGEPLYYQHSSHVPPEIEEQFWQHVVDIEKAPRVTRRQLLRMDGFEPKPPSQIPEDSLHVFLWELIEALADRNHYLEQTDHLSDRELYCLLFDRVLDETVQVLPKDTAWCFHVIVSEYGSIDGEMTGDEIFLRYYADDDVRQQFAKDFPDMPLPPLEDPPYDRDYKLPGGPKPLDE